MPTLWESQGIVVNAELIFLKVRLNRHILLPVAPVQKTGNAKQL